MLIDVFAAGDRVWRVKLRAAFSGLIMGRYHSPLVKHDLSRLEDPESRHIALTSLKNCVKQLEAECLPFFLDQIGEAHHDISRPYVISLYEDIARTHQTLLVPYIPRIMEALITALSESGSSLHVHRACAKVVAALSKFCIDLERLTHQAKEVLRLLCEPLLCVLVGKFEPVSAGAAVSLQALVESENWIHATKELVNEVCFRVTAAMSGKSAPTVAHLHLACAVAKVNREVFESYGLELMNAAKHILQTAGSWTLRVAAAQLLNLVLSMVDGIVLSTEIASVIDVLERYRLDRMPKVRSSVAEALRTAKSCYYSGGRATTKMIFSVGAEAKKRQELHDAGIRSILLPSFPNEFGKRDAGLRRPVASKFDRGGGGSEDVGGYDFVIVEDYEPCQRFGRRSSNKEGGRRFGNRPGNVKTESRVRHTVSAEPGGYVIQEWIKVDDHERYPHCGVLAGIEEGEEYDEEPTYVRESMYGKQFYSPSSERHVVIFDEDQVVTDTCKRLIENSEAPSTSTALSAPEPVPPTSEPGSAERPSSSNLIHDPEQEEWSVRDNPIAAKSDEGRSPYERSVTPPVRLDAARSPKAQEVIVSNVVVEKILEPTPLLCDEEQIVQQEVAAFTGTGDKPDELNRDMAESNDCSLKNSPEETEPKIEDVTEEMVDTFRRSWEILDTNDKHEVAVGVVEGEEVTKVCSSRKQQLVSAFTGRLWQEHHQGEGWHKKFQNGMERLLVGSVCAVLAIPAAMALIKCLEPNFGGREMVPT